MSFLNLKAIMPQQKTPPSNDNSTNKQRPETSMARKISNSSDGEMPSVFVAGSPESPGASISTPVIRYEEPVRLFICDRRRAILEKIVEPVPSNKNSLNEPPPMPNVFLAEQYADNSSSSWAFRFDLHSWNDCYNIDEICLQNFCSFLDREHGKMAMDGGQRMLENQKGPKGGPPQNPMVLTPPYSGDSRSPSGGATNAQSEHNLTAYHRLPSSQSAACSDQPSVLDEEACDAMKTLSAGRLERLAAVMKYLNPSHVVFRDHSCYPHRPTLLLFWFLTQLRNRISRLTLDSIQSDSRLSLHDVVDFNGLEELNVIQPSERPAFVVTGDLLMKWLNLNADAERCQLRLSLTGCKGVTARGLSQFLTAWRNTTEPVVFDTISVDAATVRVEDFVHEIEGSSRPGDSDWRPPTPPSSSFGLPTKQSVQSKLLTFVHKKRTACVHYEYFEGRLIFSCVNRPPLPASAMPRAFSLHSFGQYQHRSTGRLNGRNSLHRNTTYSSTLSKIDSVDQLPESSLVNRMFGFLLRSNA